MIFLSLPHALSTIYYPVISSLSTLIYLKLPSIIVICLILLLVNYKTAVHKLSKFLKSKSSLYLFLFCFSDPHVLNSPLWWSVVCCPCHTLYVSLSAGRCCRIKYMHTETKFISKETVPSSVQFIFKKSTGKANK